MNSKVNRKDAQLCGSTREVGLPDGWEMKKLGEVCEIVGGSQPSKTKFIYQEKKDYVRLIQVRDYRTDKFMTYIPKSDAKRICTKEDIMIGRYGPPIFGIFRGLEGAYNVALMKAIPDEQLIDKEYFYKFLHLDDLVKFVENSSKRAVGQDGVRKELLYEYPIPVPPLPEQKRIVAILDEAFTSIARAKENAQKNLSNARELFESYLQGVDANKCSIGELVEIKTGKLDANAAVENGKYPFFTCSRETFSINDFAFDCEAILLAGNNAVGDFNVKHYIGKFNAYQRTYVITVNEKNRILYRYLYFQMLRSLKEFKEKSVGAGTKFLKIGMIQNLQIPLPQVDIQNEIVKSLDAINDETIKLDKIYRKKLDDLDELKKSILDKAFKGVL